MNYIDKLREAYKGTRVGVSSISAPPEYIDFINLSERAWPALVEVVAAAQALRDESPWFYGDLKKALEKLRASVGEGG